MDRDQFYQEVENILFLMREAGVRAYFEKFPDKNSINPYRLLEYSNTALKMAQEKILELMIVTENSIAEKKSKLIELSKVKTDNQVKWPLQQAIKLEQYWQKVLRHLMDSMVWQVVGGKIEIVKSLNFGVGGKKSLTDKGFLSTKKVMEELNQDSSTIALLSDLTSNIDVGDLLVLSSKGLEVIEVKSGDVNEAALNLLHFYEVNKLPVQQSIQKISQNKFRDQVERILRQKHRSEQGEAYLRGERLDLGNNIRRGLKDKPDTEIYGFASLISKLIRSSYEKGYSFDTIEGILYVGAYRLDYRESGEELIKKCCEGHPAFDIRGAMDAPIVRPIFTQELSINDMMQIVKAEVVVVVGVDWGNYMDYANRYGGEFRWATKREKADATATEITRREIFVTKNKAIVLKRIRDEGNGLPYLTGGIVSRIVFGLESPLGIIATQLSG